MDWEREHRTRVEANAKKVKDIYRQAAQEAALIGATITDFNPDRPFSFDDYTNTTRRVNDLMIAMSNQIQATIVNGATVEWEQSNFKNNELARSILGFNRPSRPGQQLNLFEPPPEAETNPVLARYFNNNTDARDAFIARKTEGMNLSNRVWKYTNQFKTEIEMSLDDGIRNGHPAAQMARDLRQFLVEPDRVYRRFQMYLRDPEGNFVLDRDGNRIMIKQERRRYIDPQTGQITWRVEENPYKPGQGVYRSSLRNSQRLSRTENNMAYRTADHTRMQQMDFIVGQEITLSNAHLVSDICDQLKGKYPKEFFYKGWHPHCFCPVKFILKTADELKVEIEQILNQQSTTSESVNQVTEMPDGFKQWVEDNRERVQRARTTPYFIADNFVQGDINNQMTYIPIQAQRAAQNALEAAAERARIEAAIRREAERVRMEEEARQVEAARIEAERIEAARVEEARLARNAARTEARRLRREAQRIAEAERLAEAARLARLEEERIEAERLEAERVEAERVARLAPIIAKAQRKIAEAAALNITGPQMDALVNSITVPNPTAANIQYRIDRMNIVIRQVRLANAEAARIAEIARLAQIEAERIEAERLAAQQQAATSANAELAFWIAKAQRKIAEARAKNAHGPELDALIASISVPSPSIATIRYRIVAMTTRIREMRNVANAAAAGQVPAATTTPAAAPTVTPQRATRTTRASRAAAAATAPATGTATITAATTETELLAILRSKYAANRAVGYEGYIMDWWEGFMNGGPIGISGNTRRDELLRGIRRMEEFETSHRTGRFTEEAKKHFKGITPPPPPRKPGEFRMDAQAKSYLQAKGYNINCSVTEKEWMDSMRGFDMVEFETQIDASFKKYGIRITNKVITSSNGTIKIQISNGDYYAIREGKVPGGFTLTRTFDKNGSETINGRSISARTVSHDFLALDPKLQGNDLVKEVFSSLYTQYKKGEFEVLKVHANLDVGGYTWGRYGFIAKGSSADSIKRWIRNKHINSSSKFSTYQEQVQGKAEMIKYIDSLKGKDIDMNYLTSIPGAHEIMLDSDWYGYVQLADQRQRKVFEEYLAKRKKKP